MRVAVLSAIFTLGLLFAAQAVAADASPAGTWTQVDDETGKPKSIIEVTKLDDGTLQGVVRQVLFSDQGPHPICDKCQGERHNQPVEGMTIMWGVKKTGDNEWSGGQILDPAKGKTYKVKLSLEDNGQKLDVRGYIGTPLLGRTQTWSRRAEPTAPSTTDQGESAAPAPAATSQEPASATPAAATTSGSPAH